VWRWLRQLIPKQLACQPRASKPWRTRGVINTGEDHFVPSLGGTAGVTRTSFLVSEQQGIVSLHHFPGKNEVRSVVLTSSR
jgi:hypothetical protein